MSATASAWGNWGCGAQLRRLGLRIRLVVAGDVDGHLFVAAHHVPSELLELGQAKVTGGNHLQQLAHRKTSIGIVGHR